MDLRYVCLFSLASKKKSQVRYESFVISLMQWLKTSLDALCPSPESEALTPEVMGFRFRLGGGGAGFSVSCISFFILFLKV